MKIFLFYIGDGFYDKSGSTMSLLYEVGTHNRYDFGCMQRDLAEGHEFVIRQADDNELLWAYKKLSGIQK